MAKPEAYLTYLKAFARVRSGSQLQASDLTYTERVGGEDVQVELGDREMAAATLGAVDAKANQPEPRTKVEIDRKLAYLFKKSDQPDAP